MSCTSSCAVGCSVDLDAAEAIAGVAVVRTIDDKIPHWLNLRRDTSPDGNLVRDAVGVDKLKQFVIFDRNSVSGKHMAEANVDDFIMKSSEGVADT